MTTWIELKIAWDKNSNKPYVSMYEVGLDNEPIAKIKASLEKNEVYVSYINFFHPLLTLPSKQKIGQAFKKMFERDNEKPSSDYGRAEYFKSLIKTIATKPNKWLYKKFFSQNEYEAFCQLANYFLDSRLHLLHLFRRRLKEQDAQEKDFIEAIDSIDIDDYTTQKVAIEEFSELDEEEIEKLATQDNNLLKIIDDKYGISLNIEKYMPFTPYEFLFCCLQALPIKSINEELNIVLDMTEALPEWDKETSLSIDIDTPEEGDDGDHGDVVNAIRSFLTQSIVGPGQILKDELQKLSYLGPIRSRIPRNYVPNRYVEKRNWPDGLAAWDVLHKEDEKIVKLWPQCGKIVLFWTVWQNCPILDTSAK
jgi:hypothetical protein